MNCLIEHETRFLQAHGGRVRHIPQLLDATRQIPVAALALPFLPGKCPQADDAEIPGNVLGAWFSGDEHMDIASFPQWRRFIASGASFPQEVRSKLEGLRLKPVIFHGDFAPWNLRADSNNRLMALDWERGEDRGIPGWDWFHYVVQSALLIRKEKPQKIYKRIRRLFGTDNFRKYADAAGFMSKADELFASYLIYAVGLGQSEGAECLIELRDLACAKFKVNPTPS